MNDLRDEFARYKSARAAMSFADDAAEERAEDAPPPPPPPPAAQAPLHPDLLPDPPRAEIRYTLISVDDHLVEPAHLFEGRMPAAFADVAPRVTTTPGGDEAWVFDGVTYPQVGLDAAAGRRVTGPVEPLRFEEIRRGCWDPDARVHDMDLAGIWASVNFPSQITGFCGAVYSGCSDPALGKACVRAFNDWYLDEWVAPHAERFVPIGITFLADPEAGAAEIRRNAARGFRAVSLPDQPQELGFPTLHSGWWDPVVEACVETGTVVCLHVGGSGIAVPDLPADGPRAEEAATLFPTLPLRAATDWVWSPYPRRHPDLRIVMAEGGLGWVPMLADRLDHIIEVAGHGGGAWGSNDVTPREVLLRNFWFCSLDDRSIWPIRDRIGIDHILVETDYPRAGSTWPDPQSLLAGRLADLSVEEARKVTHENASALFGHPLPADVRP